MPTYPFINTKTGEIRDEVYRMSDVKDYRGPKGDAAPGVWKRVWTRPQMGIDTVNIDPHSAADFVKATNKRGVMGDLWERSAELSAARAAKEGGDPVKQSFYDGYARKRRGGKHPQQKREDMAAKLKKVGVSVDFGES